MDVVQSSLSLGVELSAEVLCQAFELNRRLSVHQFTERSQSSSRRSDGEVIISPSDGPQFGLQIRLMAYQFGRSAVIELCCSHETARGTRLMTRESAMSGDDRNLFAIPREVQAEDLTLAEALVYGACTCVARGTVSCQPEGGGPSRHFKVFLPSLQPLPFFDENFQIVGLPSLY
jgi:hypothetical protein